MRPDRPMPRSRAFTASAREARFRMGGAVAVAVLAALLVTFGSLPGAAQEGGIGAPATPTPTPSASPTASPTPSTRPPRVAVLVEARNFHSSAYYSGSYHNKVINFDTFVLRSHIRGKLVAVAPQAQMLLEGDNADYVLRAHYTGDGDEIHGTFILVDAQGVVLLEDSGKTGMPFFSGDDMTVAAMKRAREIADRLAPKFGALVPKTVPVP